MTLIMDNESLKFATRKWYNINDQNNGQYGRRTIKVETKVIKPNLVITQMHMFL